MTELLDFLGQGLYSLNYHAPQSTPGYGARAHRTERWQQEGVSCLGRRVTSFSCRTRGREPHRETETPREPQPGAFLFLRGALPPVGSSFPLAFLALLVPLVRTRVELVVAVGARALAYGLQQGLPGGLPILITGVAGSLLGAFLTRGTSGDPTIDLDAAAREVA